MKMEVLKKAGLVAMVAASMGLAGCLSSTDGGFDPSKPNNGATAGTGCPQGQVLQGAQCTVSSVVDDLAGLLGSTGIPGAGALVDCLDPTLNDVLSGVDQSLVTPLLTALSGQGDLATQITNTAASAQNLASAIASLGLNVPTAIAALAGDPAAAAACAAASGPSSTP